MYKKNLFILCYKLMHAVKFYERQKSISISVRTYFKRVEHLFTSMVLFGNKNAKAHAINNIEISQETCKRKWVTIEAIA